MERYATLGPDCVTDRSSQHANSQAGPHDTIRLSANETIPGWPPKGFVSRRNPEDQLVLRLKNGSQANVRLALTERNSLNDLMRVFPQHFKVLLALCMHSGTAQSHPGAESGLQESVDFLRDQYRVVLIDGTVDPLTKNVLVSSYQETPDGPMLTQPFALDSPGQKRLADMIERTADEFTLKWIRDILLSDEEGRSR